MDVSLWAPVVAALGSSILTLGGTFGLQAYLARRRARETRRQELRDAYTKVLSSSADLLHFGNVLHNAMQSRSGIGEGLDVLLRVRKPLEPLEVGAQLGQALQPLNEAWGQVWALGSAEAVSAANNVVSTCAEYIDAVTSIGEEWPRPVRRYLPTRWSKAQLDKQRAALRVASEARKTFGEVAREELGSRRAALFTLQDDAKEGEGRRLPSGGS